MTTRRAFIAGAGAGLATPLILKLPARGATRRVRRDVMELSDDDPFFAKYAAAVRAMHMLPEGDGRNWWRQAKIHADYCKHRQLQFLHWHRHYITFFESICGQLINDVDFSLPYWNWSKNRGIIPAPFFDIQELNVEHWNDPGVYSSDNWRAINTIGRRGLVRGQGLLDDPTRRGPFTSETIDSIKKVSNAEFFENSLEGQPHNTGHTIVGALAGGGTGHIGSGLSPLDPIFWLHHCMVDKIWAEWQRAGNQTPDPGETYTSNFFDKDGGPKTVAAKDALDIATLGYTYDVLEASANPAAGQGAQIGENAVNAEKTPTQGSSVATLGSAENKMVSEAFVETWIKVSAPGLLGILGQKAADSKPRRIIASFTSIIPSQEQSDLVVNVFVDHSELLYSTTSGDEHYAGTFSFFGHSHHNHDGLEFVVDITQPVSRLAKQSLIKDELLTVQLMPLPAYRDGKSDSKFVVGQVEIVAV